MYVYKHSKTFFKNQLVTAKIKSKYKIGFLAPKTPTYIYPPEVHMAPVSLPTISVSHGDDKTF